MIGRAVYCETKIETGVGYVLALRSIALTAAGLQGSKVDGSDC